MNPISKRIISQQKSKEHLVDYPVLFEELQLSNGLNVILSKDETIPSVCINLCYHVGSKEEESDKTGFAHLFEHLMFEGSKNLPKGEYDRYSISSGGDNNAYTTHDKTNYFITLPSHMLELGLWLESDRMLEFAVNQESFENQQSVVIEEKKQTCDNQPYGTVSEHLNYHLFKGSKYEWDIIGKVEDISSVTLEDAKAFYNKFYSPENAVISIVGGIDINETRSLVEKYFGEIQRPTSINRQSKIEILPSSEKRHTIQDDVHLPGVFIGYRIPEENSDDFFNFNVLSYILSSGDSSRFYRSLMYDNELVSDFGCWVDARESAGVFNMYAIAMPGVPPDKIESEMYRIINDIKSGNVDLHEIEKSINRIETRYVNRKQYIMSKADSLAHFKTFYGDASLINTNFNRYSYINISSITESANKYLNENNRVVLNYIPKHA